jgi:PAS domain S-box-containing protein
MNLVTHDIISDQFGTSSASMLLAILDQSPDCIKILGSDGRLEYMNRNGQCAMEIDDFCAVAGAHWSDLWPVETRGMVEEALAQARSGTAAQFRSSCPTAKGTLRWWDVSVTWFDAGEGSQGYISISRDVTNSVQEQNAADAIAAEMKHRLGNAYHVVGSLLSSFARGEPEKEQFASDMLQRLNALATAQAMRGEDGTKKTLDDLVPRLVLPYETPAVPISISGLPDIALDQGEIDALAMVLGELCVNSTKHGALSRSGTVKISGRMDGGVPVLIWSEQMDHQIASHSREGGKGLKLMKRVLQARGGNIEVEWQDHGLGAVLSLQKRG